MELTLTLLKRFLMGLFVAFLFLLLLEGGAQMMAFLGSRNFRIPPPIPDAPTFSIICPGVGEDTLALCGGDGGERLMRATPFKEKPTKPRIIVFGESFVFGLNTKVEEAWPSRLGHYLGDDYEVLNFGRCGSESASISGLVRVAAKLQPTMAIFAIGNNEYTMSPYYSGVAGRHPIAFQATAEFLSRFQLYGLLHRVAKPNTPHGFAKRLATTSGHPMQKYIDALHGRPVDTRVFKDAVVDPDVTAMLEDTKRLSERFYRLRMAAMINYLQKSGVQVVLATPPHSLGDPPALSGLHDDATREAMTPLLAKMQEFDGMSRAPLSKEQAAGYAQAIEDAMSLDDRFSFNYFARARWKERFNSKEEAIEDHYRAINLDLVPDVTPEILDIIENLAEQYDAPLIKLHPLAHPYLNAPQGFFLDSIHVNARGADEIGAFVAKEILPLLEKK